MAPGLLRSLLPLSLLLSLFRSLAGVTLLAAALPAVAVEPEPSASPLVWTQWSDGVFEQAKQQDKFVLLDLEAVWCHWCHVMDDITYRDPQVIRLLQSKYLLVKVDQDSRPDLSNRYEDYGWPATVVFNAQGGEIVRRQGYIPPRPMASMLQAIIDDPSPGPSVTADESISYSTSSAFSSDLRTSLRRNFDAQYDKAQGGWGFSHKYLDGDSVEYAMLLSLHGDAEATRRARRTLAAELHLIDPVWGGAYQYSVGGVWTEPHYEKLIGIQATVMRTYALAYAQWRDPAYLKAAQDVHRYVRTFLTAPDGGFYVSQDADLVPGQHSDAYYALSDQGRRHKGIPRVDTHLYARENGWMIAALCQLYAVSGDQAALDEASKSANWVLANRSLPGGGFRHSDHDAAGPYLGDTLAMGQAFLALYGATNDRRWLDAAESARGFIAAHFAPPAGTEGFVTSVTSTDSAYHPHPERDENAQLARFANLLWHYTGNADDNSLAQKAMLYMATPAIALRPLAGGVLSAGAESTADPLHITVVAPRGDAAALDLYRAAIAAPAGYKRTDWWDPASGAPLRDDVTYPQLDRPAAFVCTAHACSSPIFSGADLTARLARVFPGAAPGTASSVASARLQPKS